jgi:hypothetical protein
VFRIAVVFKEFKILQYGLEEIIQGSAADMSIHSL